MMACMLQYSHAVQSRTHTRYGSQFVSSPSSSLLSALSKECRVLFIQTIQSCVHIYLYSIHICIFFPLFFHFDIFLFFFFCLGLLFGLKGRVKTEAPNVSDSEWNTKRTWSNSHATTRPTVKVLIF